MKPFMKWATVLALSHAMTSTAIAGPDGTFLCSGQHPYDFLASTTKDFQSFGVRSATAPDFQHVHGKLNAGAGVKAISGDGLMLVPTEAAGQGWIELRKQGKVLRRLHGWLLTWNLWSDGVRESAALTYWAGDAGEEPIGPIEKTRLVIDGDGQIIAENRFLEHADGESELGLAFSGDGTTLYEDESFPAGSVQLMDARTLQPLEPILAPKSGLIGARALTSSSSGFAVIVSASESRLFQIAGDVMTPVAAARDFPASGLEMDPRSRRILVKGRGDFLVMDFAGNVLYRHGPGGASKPGFWVSPRLAIDGSVGYITPDQPWATVLTRASGYKDARTVALDAEDWLKVKCFTPNSAALLIDDEPVLVKF